MEDFSTITGRIIPNLLVTQLKALIKELNDTIYPPPALKLSGNKPELIARLTTFITQYHNVGDQTIIRQIRRAVYAYSTGHVATIALVPGNAAGTSSAMVGARQDPNHGPHQHHSSSGSSNGQSSLHGYRNPQLPTRPVPTPATKDFKSSPFYKDIQTILQPRLCTEAKDRTLSMNLSFNIPPACSQSLKSPDYQLMIFCTCAGSGAGPMLMEFPPICEIKVNGKLLESNLRGMKNKPGTVAPANITRLCLLDSNAYNKVELIYANTTKRYLASVHYVQRYSVGTVVQDVERGKFLSKEKMLQLLADRNKDDDIMATSSTLSLKCPLGFQRIKLPCRSSYCHHLQCFDAYTFFHLNEQTPTWTCPVCSRHMVSWQEIVVDGYFKDILDSTPASLETITVQADGTWELLSATEKASDKAPESSLVTVTTTPPKMQDTRVFVIEEDSDDDEEPALVAVVASKPPVPAVPTIEIIDLISDSEDDSAQEESDDVFEDGEPGAGPQSHQDASATDMDGDTIMSEAAASLQSMAQSAAIGPLPQHVKSESIPAMEEPPMEEPTIEKSIPTVADIEIQSIESSTGSLTPQSEASPVIPARMVLPAPATPPTLAQTASDALKNGFEYLRNNILSSGRKRPYREFSRDTTPPESLSEARQRISQMETDPGVATATSRPPRHEFHRSISSPTPTATPSHTTHVLTDSCKRRISQSDGDHSIGQSWTGAGSSAAEDHGERSASVGYIQTVFPAKSYLGSSSSSLSPAGASTSSSSTLPPAPRPCT